MTRLRPAALLLLAALPGAAWAACNPVGTEDCCTKVVTEECIAVDWPRPSGIVISMTASGNYCFFLDGMPDRSQYHGIRHETWIPVEPRITCPPDRNDPFDKPIRTFVSWEMTTNEIVVAIGNGKEAIVPDGVTGYVRCVYTIRSFADSCSEDYVMCEKRLFIGDYPTPRLSLSSSKIIPRYSEDPSERPTETCLLSLDSAYMVPVSVQLSCSRVRFEDSQGQTLSHTFSPGETSFSFVISGQIPSENMDDGEIVATVQTDLGGHTVTQHVTVVWVELSLLASGSFPSDYDSENRPANESLGSTRQIQIPGYINTIGNVVLIVGDVKPADFPGPLLFHRDTLGQYTAKIVGGTIVPDAGNSNSIPRGSDESFDPIYVQQADFLPPPDGHIYDLDIPGLGFDDIAKGLAAREFHVGDEFLARYNFVEYVPSVWGRCSNDFYWYSRTSVVIDYSFHEDGIDFRFDASNDNEVGEGQTMLAP